MTTRGIFITVLLAALTVGSSEHARAQLWQFGGSPLLTVASGPAGGEPVPVTNTSASLFWLRQIVVSKITVSTSCPGQHFTLRVAATNVSAGVASPEVTLNDGMLATNLITNIPAGGAFFNTCTLRYTAASTFSQGNSSELGNDVHSVSYTLLAQ
jgi:hypothetical protein